MSRLDEGGGTDADGDDADVPVGVTPPGGMSESVDGIMIGMPVLRGDAGIGTITLDAAADGAPTPVGVAGGGVTGPDSSRASG